MPTSDVTGTYYAGDGTHGYGAQLQVSDGASPPAWASIANVERITPGDMSTERIKKTHLRSPEAHHEYVAGMRDSGEFQFEGSWSPTDWSQSNAGGGGAHFASGGLVAFWRARTVKDWRILLPDGTTSWPFSGFVSKYQPGEVGIDDIIRFTGAIMPVGDFSADLP